MTELFYRYESVRYAAPYNGFDDFRRGRGRLAVELRTYRVARTTPCGVRLDTGRFVNIQRRKQFAHATKEAALEAFLQRQSRYAAILASRLADAEEAIRIAKTLAGEQQPCFKL